MQLKKCLRISELKTIQYNFLICSVKEKHVYELNYETWNTRKEITRIPKWSK